MSLQKSLREDASLAAAINNREQNNYNNFVHHYYSSINNNSTNTDSHLPQQAVVVSEENDAVVVHGVTGETVAHGKALQLQRKWGIVLDNTLCKSRHIDASIALTSHKELVAAEWWKLEQKMGEKCL